MRNNIKNRMMKMKENSYSFYYRNVGEQIKKKRIDLNLTQEDLARGICSNTYISKIENNRVIAKQEQLSMIMERMNLEKEEILLPEIMVDYLEKTFEYFFYKNTIDYKEIFTIVEKSNWCALGYIIKFGYHVLIEDYENASIYNNEIVRYFDNIDDKAFCIYLVYSIYYYIDIHDYKSARWIIKTISGKFLIDEMYLSLIYFAYYIVNGSLYSQEITEIHYDYVSKIFFKYINEKRLVELGMQKNLFMIQSGSGKKLVNINKQLNRLSKRKSNFYLLHLMHEKNDFNTDLIYANEEADYYIYILAFKVYHHLLNNEKEDYKKYLKLLESKQYEYKERIDLYGLMKAIERNDKLNVKVSLVDFVMPYIIENQSIYFIKYFSKLITQNMADRKRYKDARVYEEKYRKVIEKIRAEE